ncbi:uncharacterized protein LOC111721684 [Sarcophilus harrisii]|uniref:uncharacterized protein LOC111721684 n=1 Tax=Sarcophilus harrisii TaxID=9305 RepID=UPI001301C99F|nr:uncharacterized protein LOC111721684 [Sarcophilus harrisii]
MDWKTWETFNRTDDAVTAFSCTAGCPPPKTAPGHVPGAPDLTVLPAYVGSGLPWDNPLKQVGNHQQNSRGCHGGLHLHSRGSSSKDSSRTCIQSITAQNFPSIHLHRSLSEKFIAKPVKHSREERVPCRPSAAQHWVLFQRQLQYIRVHWQPSSPQQGVLLPRQLQDMVLFPGFMARPLNCTTGDAPYTESSLTWRVILVEHGGLPWNNLFKQPGNHQQNNRVPGPQPHRMASSLCRSFGTLTVIPVQQEGKSSLEQHLPWWEETFRK